MLRETGLVDPCQSCCEHRPIIVGVSRSPKQLAVFNELPQTEIVVKLSQIFMGMRKWKSFLTEGNSCWRFWALNYLVGSSLYKPKLGDFKVERFCLIMLFLGLYVSFLKIGKIFWLKSPLLYGGHGGMTNFQDLNPWNICWTHNQQIKRAYTGKHQVVSTINYYTRSA